MGVLHGETTTTDFAPGMRVVIRGEEWMVRKVVTNSLSKKTLHCTGVSTLVKDREAMFFADAEEIEQVDPSRVRLVADGSPFFRRSKLYIESQWRQKIPTDSALHIGHRAAMDSLPFQLDPAQMALKKQRQRILIADSVGLGKTLEAGVLISELIARGKGKRILVVTVRAMMLQFQKEMWNRFTIPLVRLDSGRIDRIRSELPANYNPFSYYDKTIVSIDTIKQGDEYKVHLENSWWDIIVIDEAHNVAERGGRAFRAKQAGPLPVHSERARLAKLLSERSDTLIMLSATPHDGKSESFASLMTMLDYTAIADPRSYRKEDIKGLFVRRFKKDIRNQIQDAFKERMVSVEKCDATLEEESAYALMAALKLDMGKGRDARTGHLLRTVLEKAMFSSPAACIKSIDERLKKLLGRHGDAGAKDTKDIDSLKALKAALEKIGPQTFSRYQRLLALLKDKSYGWTGAKDDRVVIFTERIETMNHIAEMLRRDLDMEAAAVQTIHGEMKDTDQTKIVEAFGLGESPVRILVASDVASEGINLHHLCHRLIHFDIPWSLMVFQQRNGRIDRYGQNRRPDIRYFTIHSANPKINGDARIIEILIQKEKQALENLGDPALLMGGSSVDEEEAVTYAAIETGEAPEAFGDRLTEALAEFDPFEALMAAATETQQPAQVADDATLYSDRDYLKAFFDEDAQGPVVKDLEREHGVEITVSDGLRRRLKALLPEEAVPGEGYLRLSPDKKFAMQEIARSHNNSLSENAWPRTQYLWKLHPLFTWINDKSGLLFRRGEAPALGLPDCLAPGDVIFLMACTVPNRKSAPVVDEWFGLHYTNGALAHEYSMDDVLRITKLSSHLPNHGPVNDRQIQRASKLLESAVAEAKRIMEGHIRRYNSETAPMIEAEVVKLGELEAKHMNYQRSLLGDMHVKSEKEREIDKVFNEYADWVRDTLQIEGKPYVRLIAALIGAEG